MAWYIVDVDDWSPETDYDNARVVYGPFGTAAEARAFADEPANAWFAEAHGPIVERSLRQQDVERSAVAPAEFKVTAEWIVEDRDAALRLVESLRLIGAETAEAVER